MEGWQNPQNFAIGLFVALLFVFLLVVSVVLLMRMYVKRILHEQEKLTQVKVEYQQSLLRNSVLTQEKERERIAKDLHDDLISKLTVLTYALQIENSKVNPVELLNESIKIARRITHDLTPPLLDQTSLKDLIDDFVAPLSQSYNVDCFYGHHQCCALNSEVKLQLFRIVQEVINNMLKHAKASEIVINLRITKYAVSLIVRDNGVGFDTNISAKGLGLKNIELRTQILKAQSKFKSRPEKGSAFLFCYTYN
jgi:two-component system, NarL family, sensor kinase